jgi:hypothetical protein
MICSPFKVEEIQTASRTDLDVSAPVRGNRAEAGRLARGGVGHHVMAERKFPVLARGSPEVPLSGPWAC